MRRREFLAGLGAGSAAGVAGCGNVMGGDDGATATAGPPRLSVDGRWLTDPSGRRVVLRGVNVPGPVWGTEHAEARGNGYWETLRLATDSDAGWHSRVLRVPATPETIDSVGVEQFASEYLDRAVELAAEQGVYLLVDYHAVERYDTRGVDERLRSFWEMVAPRYADDSHVLYELFSEPTEPATGGIEAWRSWRETATPWVDLVREQAPETPVVVGSPRWSSMTNYAAAEPFADDNVVYSAHIYPSWSPESWEPTFGDPALSVPVFVTEWGYVDDSGVDSHMVGTTSEWGEPFRRWLSAHDNVSWCARAFDSRWVPPMFDTDWSVLGGEAYMGRLVKRWLDAERTANWPPRDADAPTATPVGTSRPPAAPESLGVSAIAETAAQLAWLAPGDPDGDDILQYRLAVDDGEPTILRGSVQSYELTGLRPGTTYTVSLSAVDETGRESAAATTTFTTLQPANARAVVPRTRHAPDVDGAVDDVWNDAEPQDVAVQVWGNDDTDISAQWRALWDDEALYVLVSVADAELRDNDAVEVYLDLDHSEGRSYDGENDLQLVFVPGGGRAIQGTHSAGTGPVDVATVETADGWRLELAVPWTDYGVSPLTGHRFGMDVHAVDDVAGGSNRDAKVVWHDTTDEAWRTPAKFATVELGGLDGRTSR